MFWSFWIYVHWLSRETHSTNRAITAKTAPTGKILVGIVDIATRQQAERAAVGIQGGVNFSLLQKKKKKFKFLFHMHRGSFPWGKAVPACF